MPRVRWSADAGGEGDGGVLFVGLPVAALAADAAGSGEDRGGDGRRDVRLSGVRDVMDGRGRTSCLGKVLLSRLPQTVLAEAAHAAARSVRPRIWRTQDRSTCRAARPFRRPGAAGWCEVTGFQGKLTA